MFGRIARLVSSGVWASAAAPQVQTVTPTGNSQATAAPVTGDIVITSGGTATSADGILLPKAQKGDVVLVRHPGGYTLDVWPAKGDAVNAASADAVFTGVTTGKNCLFVAVADGVWATVLSA